MTNLGLGMWLSGRELSTVHKALGLTPGITETNNKSPTILFIANPSIKPYILADGTCSPPTPVGCCPNLTTEGAKIKGTQNQ
jgi:hypothetical protein